MRSLFRKKRLWGLLLIFTVWSLTELHINRTKSLKGIAFIVVPLLKNPKVGDLVAFKGQKTSFGEMKTLIKRVGGKSFTSIKVQDTHVYLNPMGEDSKDLEIKVGPIYQKTREGFNLTPLKKTQVGEGEYFVYGDHPRSFDSRYGEFGLLLKESIIGRAWRIL